jgi:hypothetical protein
MSALDPNDHRFIAARRRQADVLVSLMNEAPKLEGETFWHSVAFHLLDAGYSRYEPLPHVMRVPVAEADPVKASPKLGRGRPRVTICKRGHDQTVEGARNERGACIPCSKDRYKEHKASQPPKDEAPKKEVPAEMLAALCELQALSSKTRNCTPLGHEYRNAGDLLAEMALEAMSEYGVNATSLSLQMGLSSHTMRNFLKRRGAIPSSSSGGRSLQPYKNVYSVGRPVQATCSRGHDVTEEGSRYSDGNCKICARARQRGYYHEKKVA